MFDKPACEGLDPKVRKIEQAKSVSNEAEATLAAQLSLDSIISKASRRFLSETDLDKSIDTCLEEIGHFCSAGRAYLFQFASDGSIMNNTHEWCAPGVRPEIESLQGLPIDMFPWWMKILKAGENIHVKNVAEMLPEARAEKEILEAQNIKSVLVVPFLVENRLAGFLGFDNVASTRAWGKRELVLLRTLAEIIGTAVARRRAEDALRHNEELLQLFVKHTPAAVAMCDRQMRYLSYSDRWAQDYGLGVENLVGCCHYDLFPDLPAHWKKEHQRCFDGEVIKKDVEPFPRKDGSMDWVRRELCPWHHRSGDIGGLIMFTEVITDKKRLEDQLRQSQKMEAIGTLAGGIAHNFNNLLMGIQGRTSLLSFDIEPSHPHAEHISAIEDNICSGTHLTKQLLGFAQGGKYEVRPIDINELLIESATMFGRMKKEIHIHTKLRKQPPVVAADHRQIEQVLLNLYINAWQAMPDGGELYLETKVVTLDEAYCKPYQAKPGSYAKVSVTDTGIGMDESICQRIFDPFFTTKDHGCGTGLGLASAYGIIKNHAGIITVHSQVGQGTKFNIYLPISEKKVHKEVPTGTGFFKGSGTILLVEDEEAVSQVVQGWLEELGYRVIVARGGKRAVNVVEKQVNEIDLVILDLVMPEMGGERTFDLIRVIQPAMPVILSSGYSLNNQVNTIMQKGCNAFIQKPFTITELSQKVRKILDEGKRPANTYPS